MKFKPKNLSIGEIAKFAGYEKDVRGYRKKITNETSLHILRNVDSLELHFDREVGNKKHESTKYNRLTRKEMKELKEIDRKHNWVVWIIERMIRVLLKIRRRYLRA